MWSLLASLLASPVAAAPPPGVATVKLNFPQPSRLADFVRFAAHLRGVELVPEDQAQLEQQKIALVCERDIPPEAVWPVLEAAIKVSGFAMQLQGKTLRISRARSPEGPGLLAVDVLPVQGMMAEDVRALLPKLPPGTTVTPHPPNLLIMSGYAADVASLHEVVVELERAAR